MATPVTLYSYGDFLASAHPECRIVLGKSGDQSAMTAAVQLSERQDRPPTYEGLTYGAREIPFCVFPVSGADLATFTNTVDTYFAPYGGRRVLRVTRMDGATVVESSAVVTTYQHVAGGNYIEGVLTLDNPVWSATTDSTAGSSPATVTGNAPAHAIVGITPSGTTLNRYHVTITETDSAELAEYPYVIAFDSTGVGATAAENYFVFYNMRAIPFQVLDPDDAATKIFVRIYLSPLGTCELDIYAGSDINNTLTANTLDMGGMDFDNASFSNSNWMWDNWKVMNHPNVTGQWKPAKLFDQGEGINYGITAHDTTGVTISVTGAYPNDADAIVVTLGCRAGGTNALSGGTISYTITGLTAVAKVAIRKKGEIGWTTAIVPSGGSHSAAGSGSLTLPLDIDDAVQIAIGGLAQETSSGVAVGISGTMAIALTGVPTHVVDAPVTARLLDGTITSSTTGDTITLRQVFCDDTVIQIDGQNQRFIALEGPVNSPDINPLELSNPTGWFVLVPGANVYSETLAGTVELGWYEQAVA